MHLPNIRRPRLAAAAVLLLSATACQQPHHEVAQQEAQQRWAGVRGRVKLQLAQQQYDAQQFESAVVTATEALSLDPSLTTAYVLRADSQMELGRLREVEQTLQLAAHAGIESAQLTYLQGLLCEQRRDLDGALACYRTARQRSAEPQVDFVVAEAECLVAADQPEAALALIDSQAQQFPDDATLAVLGADVAELLGRDEEAAIRYREALLAVTASRVLPETYGLLLVRIGHWSEAIEVLHPLLDDPDNPPRPAVRRALAAAYLENGEPQLAYHLLAEYAADHRTDTRAHLLLAKSAVAAGDPAAAQRALQVALQAAPQAFEVQLVQAVINWRIGALEAAARTLEELRQRAPQDVEVHCLLAEVRLAQGDYQAARRQFDDAVRLDPQNPWARAGRTGLARSGLLGSTAVTNDKRPPAQRQPQSE